MCDPLISDCLMVTNQGGITGVNIINPWAP